MGTCCFFGNPKLDLKNSAQLENELREAIKYLLDKGISRFIFGCGGKLEFMAWRIVTDLQASERYPYLQRVLCADQKVASKIEEEFKSFTFEFSLAYGREVRPFDKIINCGNFDNLEKAGDVVIINMADVCVCYVDTFQLFDSICRMERSQRRAYINFLTTINLNKYLINLFSEQI